MNARTILIIVLVLAVSVVGIGFCTSCHPVYVVPQNQYVEYDTNNLPPRAVISSYDDNYVYYDDGYQLYPVRRSRVNINLNVYHYNNRQESQSIYSRLPKQTTTQPSSSRPTSQAMSTPRTTTQPSSQRPTTSSQPTTSRPSTSMPSSSRPTSSSSRPTTSSSSSSSRPSSSSKRP